VRPADGKTKVFSYLLKEQLLGPRRGEERRGEKRKAGKEAKERRGLKQK